MVLIAVVISLTGSLVAASRQLQIHALQNQLLQTESSYALQVGKFTNQSAPSAIASQASSLHLVSPVAIIQIPSVPLSTVLAPPKFMGSAITTPRTQR